jgi:cytoskeletal protein CcmA (bactofilin family)
MSYRRGVLVAVLALLVLAPVTVAVAVAQAGAGGGTVVVEEGETVDSIEAITGSVVVRGTVEGNVNAFAGDVTVTETGRVTGEVGVVSGSVQIDGRVGSLAAAAGEITVGETGVVDGDVQAAAGTITIAGEVGGDATLGAERVTVTETGSVAGDLAYNAETYSNEGTVGGAVSQTDEVFTFGPVVPPGVVAGYWLLVRLLVGAVFLAAFPTFAAGVSERVSTDPVRTGLAGLVTVLAVPVVLVLLLVTIVGIPVSLVGLFAFLGFAWLATIYGSYAVGEWLLGLVDTANKWLALVVGLVLWFLLGYVPVAGAVAKLGIFLLGLGAMAVGVRGTIRRSRESGAVPTTTERSTAETDGQTGPGETGEPS